MAETPDCPGSLVGVPDAELSDAGLLEEISCVNSPSGSDAGLLEEVSRVNSPSGSDAGLLEGVSCVNSPSGSDAEPPGEISCADPPFDLQDQINKQMTKRDSRRVTLLIYLSGLLKNAICYVARSLAILTYHQVRSGCLFAGALHLDIFEQSSKSLFFNTHLSGSTHLSFQKPS
ncbi:MAG: hypothetical protein HY542_00945 [Deltaproteobacteria bacterium]|nr:hypothetical protein [Deltaproteobacteria bacterium]